MTPEVTRDARDLDELIDRITREISSRDLTGLAETIAGASTNDLVEVCERLPEKQLAVTYRLLPKQRALEVFEALPPALQGDLVHGLQDAEVATLFAGLDPDDRVWLLDELPAALAPRLLRGLPAKDRELTAAVLGYPHGSIGHRMSPEVLTTHPQLTVAETMDRVRARRRCW